MISDDVTFLLIFIVLPTALIVSGLWLALFVRRESQYRAATRMNLTSGHIAADEDEADDSEISDLQIPLPIEEPAYELSPVVADLLYRDEPPPPPIISDERLLELLDEQDRDPMREVITATPDTAPAPPDHVERTEEFEVIDPEVAPPTGNDAESRGAEAAYAANEDVDEGDDDEGRQPAAGEDQSAATDGSGDIFNEPDAAAEGEEDSETRRRRQPASRLVPTTENVRRRGRSAGRRVPPIPRASPRDEDTVERENSV